MTDGDRGAFWAGARLVWQRRWLLVGVYGLNLVLAGLATVPADLRMSRVLDRSLAAERLYSSFDVTLLIEFLTNPQGALAPRSSSMEDAEVPASLTSGLTFLILMVFLTGGILVAYRRGRPLTAAEFSGACGAFFGRFLGLMVVLLLALAPLLAFARFFRFGAARFADGRTSEMLGFWLAAGRVVLLLLALMVVRLWFDMAQVYAVASDRRGLPHVLRSAFKLTFGNFPALFWLYLRISLLAWVALGIASWVWVALVRPESVLGSFLLGQTVLLLWLGCRLWQHASETVWYQRRPLSSSSVAAPEEAVA